MPMDHGRLENIPQTIFRGKGVGSVGLVVGGAELQPAGMEAVVPSSGVSTKGLGTFPEQLLGGGNVASVLSGVELQPDGMEVVVPSSGISAKDLGTFPEQLLGGSGVGSVHGGAELQPVGTEVVVSTVPPVSVLRAQGHSLNNF